MSGVDPSVHDDQQDNNEAQFAVASSPRSRREDSPNSPTIPSIAKSILSDGGSSTSPNLPFSVTSPPSPSIQLSPVFRHSHLPEEPSILLLISRESQKEEGLESKEEEKDEHPASAAFGSQSPVRFRDRRSLPESTSEICQFAEDFLQHGAFLTTPSNNPMASPSQQFPQNPHNTPEIFHLDNYAHPDHEVVPEFVTKALIQQWNNEIGNSHNAIKATKLIEKMRRLANLDLPDQGGPIDIPAARIGLCLLAGLNNQDNKMHALSSLLEILKNDNYTKANSVQLVDLAIQLLRLMNREVLQAVNLEAQIKIAEVYNILAETLHHHYGKNHINALTEGLKEQLVKTPKAIEKLNRLEDIELKFHTHCALEGVRRLKDDKQELFDVAERIYHLAVGAIQIYLEDPTDGFIRLEKAFEGLDPHLPNTWYDAILVLKNMARDVKEDPNQLTPLLLFIGQNYQKLNWKFSYAAVQVLFQLTLNGENEKVRSRAFNGVKQLGRDFPGLASFVDCEDLSDYVSYKPMVHLERPHTVDPNIRIRHAAIKCLHHLVDQSLDPQISKKAAFLLGRRNKLEKDPHVINALQRNYSL